MAKKKRAPKALDPSKLPGTYRTRIFVGGSYRDKALPVAVSTKGGKPTGATPRQILRHIRAELAAAKLFPILAAEFRVNEPASEIHHDALFLLHACRLAVFDLSEFSGALMEIERAADYGTRCLILYNDAAGSGWRVSRMLNSFVEEHTDRFTLYGYLAPDDAKNRVRNWLDELKRLRHA